jgi:hypothetical protein
MTAPSDLMPVCDGAQVSPGGRIGSGGKHDGGKDRTIPHQNPTIKILRLQLFPLPCNLHLPAEIGGIG